MEKMRNTKKYENLERGQKHIYEEGGNEQKAQHFNRKVYTREKESESKGTEGSKIKKYD